MVTLTFPDGARREYPQGTAGLDIAKGISPSLAKRTVAMALDNVLKDLNDPIEHDAKIEFVAREDPRALELIRHDAAHVLAEAVQSLWPGTQVTIGPVIENGFYYDFFRNEPFTPEDLPVIEKKMKEIVARDKTFTKEVWSRDQAKKVFRDKGEMFKVELIDAIPGNEPIKIYKQGDWFDLCRGPHMTSTGKVGGAFKLMKVAGAYWRGDSKREMLSRIYGTAYAKQEELDAYLKQIEEAEKRDHRKVGREMDLFHFQEEAPGSVFWHAKGWTLFQALENYIRRRQTEAGYVEVNSPQLIDKELWVTTGHIPTFSDMMFLTAKREEDERVYAIKPMNCPGHVQIFKNGLKSYRDLPLKIAEFGKVHRFEPSGALHGLMRVRAFTQDDAHVFITEAQIADECLKMNDLILSIYEDFGFEDVRIKFSDRPEKRIGEDAVWDKAEVALMQALKTSGRPWTLNKGEGAFYGPKLEYVLRDAIGRDWQCGTVQVDLNLPGRLGAFYIDEHSNKVTPVMLHRAMFGSLERFTGILIEHYAGHLPLWLSPLQAVVATITSDADDYAREVIAATRRTGLLVEGDLRNEKINYKVREHSLAKVPAMLVLGKKEAADRTVSIRRLGSEGQQVMPLDLALNALADEAVPPDVRRMKKAAVRPVARRHHFLSQCYLRGFTVEREKKRQIVVFDAYARKPFQTATDNIAVERDFNRVEAGGMDPDAFEQIMASFEALLAPALTRIIETESIENEDDRTHLLNFICLLSLRNPRFRATINDIHSQLANAMLKLAGQTKERWDEQVKRAIAAGALKKGNEITHEEVKEFIREGKLKVQLPTEAHIALEMKAFNDLLPYFLKRNWALLRAPAESGGFITSDHPVCLIWSDPAARGGIYSPGFGMPGTEVIFPISSRLAVIGAYEIESLAHDVSEQWVAGVNGGIISFAERQVYARDYNFMYAMQQNELPLKASQLIDDQRFTRPRA